MPVEDLSNLGPVVVVLAICYWVLTMPRRSAGGGGGGGGGRPSNFSGGPPGAMGGPPSGSSYPGVPTQPRGNTGRPGGFPGGPDREMATVVDGAMSRRSSPSTGPGYGHAPASKPAASTEASDWPLLLALPLGVAGAVWRALRQKAKASPPPIMSVVAGPPAPKPREAGPVVTVQRPPAMPAASRPAPPRVRPRPAQPVAQALAYQEMVEEMMEEEES